jgi:hypothetical protein
LFDALWEQAVPTGSRARPTRSFRLSASSEFSYIVGCAVEVVGGVTSPSVTETTTVLILGIILSAFGIAFFCWLLFTLAVYALPFFVAITAALAAFHSGAGFIGAIVVGIVVGIVTLAVGQLSFAIVRSPVIRAAIALLFAVPAAVAGYHATLGLSHIAAPSHWWAEVFAFIGAVLVGATTWARMTLFADPPGTRRVLPSGSAQTALSTASTER